jgi:hypothetical protein
MKALERIKRPFLRLWRWYNQCELDYIREHLDSDEIRTEREARELAQLELIYMERLRRLDK